MPIHKYFLGQQAMNRLYFLYDALSRRQKSWILRGTDGSLFIIAIVGAFWLRQDLSPVKIFDYFWQVSCLIGLKMAIFHYKGLYRSILRYTGIESIVAVAQAAFLSPLVLVFVGYLNGHWPLPRSVLLIDALLTLVLVVGARLFIRSFFLKLAVRGGNPRPQKSVAIYGAGLAGSQLARALVHDPIYNLLAFVDDNPELHNHVVEGVKVHPPAKLPQLSVEHSLDAIILAMPSIGGLRRQEIVESLRSLGVEIETIPSFEKLLSGQLSIGQIRNLDIGDLLGREEVMPQPELLGRNVTGKAVLITGAGGSIGSELCRQVARLEPKCLVMYELNEFSLYQIDLELGEAHPQLHRVAHLGNITDEGNFQRILRQYRVETIYHAAAYKHVPLVELNPDRGVYNNVWGTWVVARSALACSVPNFVMISTDKAVRPTNVMGASKRAAESIVQALAAQPEVGTRFAIVRFGNVLGSSGSVVPRFRQQIAQGKPITLTHPDVTRYFMSIPEAVRLVMQAGAMAVGGEVFLLDMGDPVRIYDLALQMIRLSGLEPGRDIEIEITGLRPGEKLYEELLIDSEKARPTQHPKIFSAQEKSLPWPELQPRLEALLAASQASDRQGTLTALKAIVPEYQPRSLKALASSPHKAGGMG